MLMMLLSFAMAFSLHQGSEDQASNPASRAIRSKLPQLPGSPPLWPLSVGSGTDSSRRATYHTPALLSSNSCSLQQTDSSSSQSRVWNQPPLPSRHQKIHAMPQANHDPLQLTAGYMGLTTLEALAEHPGSRYVKTKVYRMEQGLEIFDMAVGC